MNTTSLKTPACFHLLVRFLRRIHRDQRGSISIASVFALLLLVFILGMVMNSSRQVDQKVKMQNAADAATYSAGIVISRSMNTLAYTNHLLCDVFAMTAYMREARDRNAESMTPQILAHWDRIAPAFAGSEFPKFAELGPAISEKVPHEREMVRTFSEWAAAASERMLPVFEEILSSRAIPEFQRALVVSTPQLAQTACDEIARRHGQRWPKPAVVRGVLWRTSGDPTNGVQEAERRTLPVFDPVLDEGPNKDMHVSDARRQRNSIAKKYLRDWNRESLEVFDKYGKMSQFSNLWRVFTQGHLKILLDTEYRFDNLPFQIRTPVTQIDNLNDHLEQDFMFVGVVYTEKIDNVIPGIFKNPVASDSLAYSQIMVYVPKRRLTWRDVSDPVGNPGTIAVPGDQRLVRVPPTAADPPLAPPGRSPEYDVVRQWRPRYPDIDSSSAQISGTHRIRWDLVNQNWSMQMVPATARQMARILSTPPYVLEGTDVDPPQLQALTDRDMNWLSHH